MGEPALTGPVDVDPSASDEAAGFNVTVDFKPFSQENDVFCRSFWDDTVRSGKTDRFYETYRKPLRHYRGVDGFQQKDYAVRNAAWHVPDVFAELKEDQDRREGFLNEYSVLRGGADERTPVTSLEETTHEIKQVARAAGADMVGVAPYDPRWTYTNRFSADTGTAQPSDLPDDLPNVIVVGTGMDYDLVKTVPSALSGAATGLGYGKDILTVLALGQYIRNLGYRAVPSLNDSALAIPYAIKAGLGEYGRNGLLITREFGPRVRFGKVFTDLPLVHDSPAQLGVREFCERCRQCSDACPPKAIPDGAPSDQIHNRSNLTGVTKWSVNAEKCFGFWAGQNSDCSICIRVCPYNKDYRHWWARAGMRLAATPLRGLMLRLDRWLGFGRRHAARSWWNRA